MKDRIINQIIHELIPLRTLYPEIDTITNDLLNDKYDSLKVFLDKNYQDTNINSDLKNLVNNLIQDGKLPNNYLNVFDENSQNTKLTEVDLINFLNSSLIGYKAIDLKHESFSNLILKLQNGYSNPNITLFKSIASDYSKFTPISDYEFPNDIKDNTENVSNNQITEPEINNEMVSNLTSPEVTSSLVNNVEVNETEDKLEPISEPEITNNVEMVLDHPKLTPINLEEDAIEEEPKEENKKINPDDFEIESLEESYIEKLRKSIMEAQLNYLNNANSFIENLETISEAEIYQKLLSLNDIRYIHHSISKLSNDTLNRLLPYISDLIDKNSHNSINIFIEESIKKNLHRKEKKM